MVFVQDNRIITGNNKIITSSSDLVWIKPNQNILSEIWNIKEKVIKELKNPKLIEVETFSVDSFSDLYVNNPDISKDLDDWFIAEKTWYWYLLKVNISSPSSVIDIYSEIFRNILLQTTSIYYDSHVNPMMAFELSNKLFSLIYNQIRLWLTVEIELDKEGNVLDYRIYRSKIKNILMSNHYEFDRILRWKSTRELNKFWDTATIISEIWKILKNNRRVNNGFSSSFDSQRKIGYNKLETNEIWYISNIVEEIMILTNRLVAEFLLKEENNDIVWIFRNHMPEYKWKKFEWWQMDRATYDIIMKHHYWLLLDSYTHFTSPIRRGSDLLLHYWINDKLNWEDQTFEKENIWNYLKYYLNPYQTELVKQTSDFNKQVNLKREERAEKNKVKNYIKQNKITQENIEEKDDFDLEINIYNKIKNNLEIEEYFILDLERRLKSKNCNKELLFILSFTKNEVLINLFNKHFDSYNMKNKFIEYFNDSDFISEDIKVSFEKVKYYKRLNLSTFKSNYSNFLDKKQWLEKRVLRKNIKNTNVLKNNKDRVSKKTYSKFFINKKNDCIFVNSNGLNKTEAFKELLEFILNTDINFLL